MQKTTKFYHRQKLNPAIKDLCDDPHDYYLFTEPNFVPLQNPMVKEPRCIFPPRIALEHVMDVRKERFSPTLASEHNQGHINKLVVKKFQKEMRNRVT